MDDDWVVAKEWALATVALRRRALMLEALLPFSRPPPADVLRVVHAVQAAARGMAARTQAHLRRRMRSSFLAWTIHIDRLKAALMVKAYVIREHHATLIQRSYRVYVQRWTRPRVSELLRRLELLEARDVTPRKKGWKKRCRDSKACQTNNL